MLLYHFIAGAIRYMALKMQFMFCIYVLYLYALIK